MIGVREEPADASVPEELLGAVFEVDASSLTESAVIPGGVGFEFII
jgi:hypothetical protein